MRPLDSAELFYELSLILERKKKLEKLEVTLLSIYAVVEHRASY